MSVPNCTCRTCGRPFYTKPAQIRLRNGGKYCSRACKYANPDNFRHGENHPFWKGQDVSEDTGRERARRMYREVSACERCGKPARDRHHINANTRDNRPENIQMLCRRCHMTVDGRLEVLRAGHTWKLTREQAEEIRQRHAALPRTPSGRCARGTVRALADEYGVGPDNVKAIVSGRNWGDRSTTTTIPGGSE